MASKISLHLFLTLLLLPFLSQAQVHAPVVDDLGYRGGSIKGIKNTPNALQFIVFGDWGRNGENYQKEVAAGMGKAAHDLHASFVIATGDNFYPYGVNSTQDYHWISSFESIYRAQSLHVKWYPVLGNHDYISNPDAQVQYSSISSRWTMPARYYFKKFFINGDTSQGVLIAFIDTDPLEKKMRGQQPDSIKYPAGGAEAQIAWLESILSDNSVKWKLVVGHHPVYTGGWRNTFQDTKNMQGLLEPLFKKYNVNLYIAGHEHHQEYYKPEGKTHYIISGAGSEGRPAKVKSQGSRWISSEQGFATFAITRDNILVQFINYKDQIIKTQTISR